MINVGILFVYFLISVLDLKNNNKVAFVISCIYLYMCFM